MSERNDPISGIIVVRSIGVEERRAGDEKRESRPRPKKPGKDSVNISSRARRLADIEMFLSDADEGQEADKGEEEQNES